ncbi:MAG: site-specific integrase, partial [Firmicutes bacterium]|nr:site-specific integrase [Bacillota bacterium]
MATVKKYISKNGDISYNIRAYAGYDRYGRQIEKRMTWRPGQGMSEKAIKKELERQIVLFEEKIKQNKVFDTNTTFEQYAAVWLNNNRPPQLAPKTFERYAEMLVNINMAIGNIKLFELQSQHLQAFYANLREAGINSRDNYAAEAGLVRYM